MGAPGEYPPALIHSWRGFVGEARDSHAGAEPLNSKPAPSRIHVGVQRRSWVQIRSPALAQGEFHFCFGSEMDGYRTGTSLTVSRDILVEGAVAFARGDVVTVEAVQPDAQRPEYRYLVTSNRLMKKFQLSDADLYAVAYSQPPQAAPPPSGYGPAQQPRPGYGANVPPVGYAGIPAKKKFPVWGIVLIVVGALLVIGLVVPFVVLPVFQSANSSANRRTCQSNLRTIDSSVNAYNGFYDAWPPTGPVEEVLGPTWLKRNPTCPITGEPYQLTVGPDGVPTTACPTNEPGHTI